MDKRRFNKGDFIKYKTYNAANSVTFGIFEGIDLVPNYQYTKKYSLAVFYDSWKYCQKPTKDGWEYRPVLDVATRFKPCEKTIDTLVEDSWWAVCTQNEKDEAIRILLEHGYKWDEEQLALIDIETKEIVHKIITPKIEYHGNVIKPIGVNLKTKLRNAVIQKNKVTYSSPSTSYPSTSYPNGYYYKMGYYEDWD